MADETLRRLLSSALDWPDAHARFDAAVADVPPQLRGRTVEPLPYSMWQLLEHLRLTQRDILDFCRDAGYKEPQWPRDYWPASAEPPSETAWDESAALYASDRAALQELATSAGVDLFAQIPHGTGQTYLRELLLVIDHNAYHIGEMVMLRRMLGVWPAS